MRTAIILHAAIISTVFAACDRAAAWNALGHKVVAEIAWHQLEDGQRQEIVRNLRRHPRFDWDFAQKMPGGSFDEDRWIFQQAATWPDLIRGHSQYDRPRWHYINIMLGHHPDPHIPSFEYPTKAKEKTWNIAQAVKHCQAVIASDAGPADKAIAYCWLFHLVGDAHQPMHAVMLVNERFIDGDRGGNSIPLARGRNLHALWDDLLGRQSRLQDVEREANQLKPWEADTDGDIDAWLRESRALAEAVAYDPIILKAVEQPGPLEPILLPESYIQNAGKIARQRVEAAGLRLGRMLNDLRSN